MAGSILSNFDSSTVLCTVVVVVLLALLAARELPGIIGSIKTSGKKEQIAESTDKYIDNRLNDIDRELNEINQMLSNDYKHLNDVRADIEKLANREDVDRKAINEEMKEGELVISALLAVIDGLQQLGANGKTTTAREELTQYLFEQAHKGRTEE